MFIPDLLTPSQRQEALDLCASIQKKCDELQQMLKELRSDEQAHDES